ncbi:PIN domain-containing protein [Kineosporia sp. J2-2]|uniref:PIN domain-containing protein n=1 Tax=Kineosporia corallincola TaxID=2835133 RepID=A0ABS5TEU6_9ACTN|nr:PIN domain-containing protein [Kineosporia corallincola]MBT0769605.1 PIN domain-containing protein [Kineosporia corallincola]
MFTALLDTCVLWPSRQRDFLLSLAFEHLYRPAWSSAILAELGHHERVKLEGRGVPRDQARARGERLISFMGSCFPDAEVSGWEDLEGTFGLPDPNDEHVAAAAVLASAGVLVTHNLKDFPPERLPRSLQVLPPAEFAYNTVSVDPARAVLALEEMARRSGQHGPRHEVADILAILENRYGMHAAVGLVRQVSRRTRTAPGSQ